MGFMWDKLKRELMERHEGASVEDLFDGVEVSEGGLEITTSRKLSMERVSMETVLCDLKLLRGVGDHRERKLKSEGYMTIRDLTRHPVHGEEASRFLELLRSGDPWGILGYTGYPCSHPSSVRCMGLLEPERFIFLDIETLGLSGEPVILTGIAWIDKDEITVKQRLARSPEEEAGVLKLTSGINDRHVLVTFNGARFDIPYIRNRARELGVEAGLQNPNIDLYYTSRRLWGSSLPDCRLKTIEEYVLGVRRGVDVPGSRVPDYYLTYLSTGNPGPLVPIVEHNQEDIVTLAVMLSLVNALTAKK